MNIPFKSEKDRPFVNYNVRYHDRPAQAFEWAKGKDIPLKMFQNYDGGGFNFYICEFATLESAQLFRNDFAISGARSLWAEHTDGSIHYL